MKQKNSYVQTFIFMKEKYLHAKLHGSLLFDSVWKLVSFPFVEENLEMQLICQKQRPKTSA